MFCKYYNPLALRDCVKGRTDRTQAAPVRQTDIGAFIVPVNVYALIVALSVVHAVEEPGISLTAGTGEDARRGRKMEGALEAATFIQGTRLREAKVVVDVDLLVLPLDRIMPTGTPATLLSLCLSPCDPGKYFCFANENGQPHR